MTGTTTDEITVTDVRKALIAESYEHLESIKRLKAKRRAGEWLTPGEVELIDALATANAYSYLLAFVLRFADERCSADDAEYLARVFDAVMDAGTEALEDANDDLDEQARPGTLDVLTAPGCHKCGIPFEFEGPKSQEPGTTYCRVCADAGPTPADIEAALDAKAEDDRIEAERAR